MARERNWLCRAFHNPDPSLALGPGYTTAKTTTTVTVTFMATAKSAVNLSHTKLSFLHNGVQFVANFLRQACSAPQRRTDLGEWSLWALLSSSSSLSHWILGPDVDYFLSVSESHLALSFLPLVAIAHFFACADPKDTYDYRRRDHRRVSHCHVDVHVTSRRYVHVRVMKRVMWLIKLHRAVTVAVISAVVWPGP